MLGVETLFVSEKKEEKKQAWKTYLNQIQHDLKPMTAAMNDGNDDDDDDNSDSKNMKKSSRSKEKGR